MSHEAAMPPDPPCERPPQAATDDPAGRVLVVHLPAEGDHVEIHVVPGMEIILPDEAFEPTLAHYLVDGTDLVALLANGSRVTLVNFLSVADPTATIALLDSPVITSTELLATVLAAAEPDAVEPAAGPPDQPEKTSGNASFTPFETAPMAASEPTLKAAVGAGRPTPEPGGADEIDTRVRPESDTSRTPAPEQAAAARSEEPPRPPPEPPAPDPEPPNGRRPEAEAPVDVPVAITGSFSGATPPVSPPPPEEPLTEEQVNGLDPRVLMLDAPRELVIHVDRLEPAAGDHPPLLGLVEIGLDGMFGAVRLVHPDEIGPDGEVSLGVLASNSRFALFTLEGPDAEAQAALAEASLALQTPEGWPAALGDGAPPVLVRIDGEGVHPVEGRLLFATGAAAEPGHLNALNPDGLAHAVSWFDAADGAMVVAIEQGMDAPGSPGRDFAEVLLRLHHGPASQGDALHFPGGDGGLGLVLPEDAAPAGAVVELVRGYRPGDRLVLEGLADRDGDGLLDGTRVTATWLETPGIELSGTADAATWQRILDAVRFTSVASDVEPGTREVEVRLRHEDGSEEPAGLVRYHLEEKTLLLPRHEPDFRGGPEDDVVHGLDGDDRLSGGPGHDYLDGGAGDDRLHGGPGDDVLVGLAGSDVLHGGPGADRFVVTSLGDGRDIVADLDVAEGDRLDLQGLFAGTAFDPAAPDAASFLRFEPADLDGDGRIDGALVVVDLDGAGRAHAPQAILALHDLERPDSLDIASATTFGHGSDGGTA